MKSLYDQLSRVELSAVSILIGFDYMKSEAGAAAFRNNLRDIAPLGDGFTMGDAARAYINHVSEMLSK